MTKGIKKRRKFLKNIYTIQTAFGQEIGKPQRTISCGLLPVAEEERRLSRWFDQVTSAKHDLYREIYLDFKKNPGKFLGPKGGFDYQTFFKGRKVRANLGIGRPLLTSQPVMEGLRNEIEGTMRSFKTNFTRLFNESLARSNILKEVIRQNNEILNKKAEGLKPENLDKLLSLLQSLENQKINHIVLSFETIQDAHNLIDSISAEAGIYNRELNEIISAYEIPGEEIQLLRKLGKNPIFPRSNTKVEYVREKLLHELESLANLPFDENTVQNYIKNRSEKLSKLSDIRIKKKPKRFEDRLISWLTKNEAKNIDEKATNEFIKNLSLKLESLNKHLRNSKKNGDARAKNEYFRLLALRAKLANKNENNINLLLSHLRGTFLSGRIEREIVNIPGFSWADKPRKNATLALKDGRLYLCISNSVSNFKIDPSGDLRFVKSTGGSRQKKAYKPKAIEYIRGIFDTQEQESNAPLFLKLHFGKSYVRRNLFHHDWGVFSKTPKIFLNAGKLKRERDTPSDKWKYFFDLSVSGEKVYSLKEFSKKIHKNAEAVVGIDRGEAKPIAYAVLSVRDGKLLDKGFLAKEYIGKLEHYDRIKKKYQENSQTFPKYLRYKVSRLKETMMATAASETLEILGRYKAIIIMENLGGNFTGIEKHLVPKKTYKKVEKLISGALEQAGILRIPQPKGTQKRGESPYWGALIQVNPGGTSQTCLQCGITWNSNLKDIIIDFSESCNFKNIDFEKGSLSLLETKDWLKGKMDAKTYKFATNLERKILKLNRKFEVFNKLEKRYEIKTLVDIKSLLSLDVTKKEKNRAFAWLKLSIGPRIRQELFICPNCNFQDNADIVGAVNIARRGIESLKRLHKGN